MTAMHLRAACLLAVTTLVLCGCPKDRAPKAETAKETGSSWRPPVMPAAKPPKAAPLTVGETEAEPTAEQTSSVKLRFLVRNKRMKSRTLESTRIPAKLTAAQLAQAPGGLQLEVGETKVGIVVGDSLNDYVRFLLGTLGALDGSLEKELASFVPPAKFMGLERVVGSAFQKDQSLLVLQATDDPETLRFSYVTPLGMAPQLPYVKDLEISRRDWIAAATSALERFFNKAEGLAAPRTKKAADQRARALLSLWHQVGWKLKLS